MAMVVMAEAVLAELGAAMTATVMAE